MLPLAPGANGQPPRPPTEASSRVTPEQTAAYALANPAPRVLWKCAPERDVADQRANLGDQVADPPRSGGADGVGDRQPVDVVVAGHRHDVEHPLRRGRSVERAVPGGRDDDLHRGAAVVRDGDDVGNLRGGLRGGPADVGAAVPVGRRHHVLDRPQARRDGPLGPVRAGHQRGELDTMRVREVGQFGGQFGRVGQRGHLRRRDERGRLDLSHAGGRRSPRAVPAWRANGIGSSICRPSRSETSRMSTWEGSSVKSLPPPVRRSSSASVLPSSPRYTSSLCWPGRAGPALRIVPGVSDSTGTTPGPRTVRSIRSSKWSAIMPRARSCGSLTTSATVLIGPLITPASDSVAMMSSGLSFGRPVADDLVQLVLVAPARNVIGEPVVGGQFGLTHRRAQPPEHGVLVGGDHHPAAVGGSVDVRRGDALQAGARRAAHHTADVVVGDGGLLDGQAGFGQRGVDHLAFAGDGAPVERGQRALRGEHAGQAVAERQRQPRRRSAGESVHVPQAADGFGDRGVAGLVCFRSGLAVAGDADQDDAAIAFAQHVVTEVPTSPACRAGSSRR